MTTDSPYIIVLSLLVLIALLLFIYLFSSRKQAENRRKKVPQTDEKAGKHCPLCGELLTNGERIHSVIYPGEPDKLMEIYGCPHCESKPGKRKCPVCKKTMAADSILIARVFEKPGKTHVHVLGCSSCYSGRSKVPHKNENST